MTTPADGGVWRWEEAVPHRPLPAVAATLGTHRREYVVPLAPEPGHHVLHLRSEPGTSMHLGPLAPSPRRTHLTWMSRAYRRSPCASPWLDPHRCWAGAHCPCPQGKSAPRTGSRRFSRAAGTAKSQAERAKRTQHHSRSQHLSQYAPNAGQHNIGLWAHVACTPSRTSLWEECQA